MKPHINDPDQRILADVVASFRSGRAVEAEQKIAKFIERHPKHPAALNFHGIILTHLGRYAEAESVIRQAITVNAGSDVTFYNLGVVLKELNRPLEALEALGQSIAMNPSVAESWNNRGIVHNALARYQDAIADFQQAVKLNARYAQAYYNMARSHAELGDHDSALAAYDAALAISPNFVEALINRGLLLLDRERHADALASFDRVLQVQSMHAGALKGRGDALHRLKRYEEALASFGRALMLSPDEPDLRYRQGNSLFELGRYEEALAQHDKALAMQPDSADAHHGRGSALQKLLRFEEALQSYDRALAIQPDAVEALYHRAVALFAMERLDEALADLDRALAQQADHAKANWARGQIFLSQGRLAEGWDCYEHRWAGSNVDYRNYGQPRWTGGKVGTLLIWGEQGLGDQMLHGSVLSDAIERAGKVVLEVEPRLVPLFKRSFPDIEVIESTRELYGGAIDVHAPIGDLGKFFRRAFEAFPRRERGFLAADTNLAGELRRRLTRGASAVIGVSWLSRSQLTGESKSVPLRDFEPVLRIPGCRFIDLQYGDTAAEREHVKRDLGIQVERLSDIDNTQNIDDLAALVEACDAVVTVSNTTAHLAGALGRPTWVMVPYGHMGYWYWFRGHEMSPWYPRVRVIRKTTGQAWPEVAQGIAGEVRKFLDQSHS